MWTHRVGSHSQALLNEPLKCCLQDQVLIGDGLLRDLLSRDGLQRLRGLNRRFHVSRLKDSRLMISGGVFLPAGRFFLDSFLHLWSSCRESAVVVVRRVAFMYGEYLDDISSRRSRCTLHTGLGHCRVHGGRVELLLLLHA